MAFATGRRARSPNSPGPTRFTRSAPAGLPWIEIDFPEDYERAVRECCRSSMRTRHPSAPRVGRPTERRTAFERRSAGAGQPTVRPTLPTRHETDRGSVRSARTRVSSSEPAAGVPTPPRVVALGGGTGLPNVLRGLRPLLYGADERAREFAPRDRLVAIVATSDDGGSSGKLRAEFNIIPPGDIRNCLAALSDNHALIADIFQYRFGAGDGLNGHAIGNLVLTALADVMNDFPRAVEIAARVVGARGTVLPATSELVTLVAEFEDGRVLSGETAIAAAGGRIARVSLIPERPRFLPEMCEVIARADVIVAGPGSLFTSVLPPLLVPDVPRRSAVGRHARARRQPDDRAGRDR